MTFIILNSCLYTTLKTYSLSIFLWAIKRGKRDLSIKSGFSMVLKTCFSVIKNLCLLRILNLFLACLVKIIIALVCGLFVRRVRVELTGPYGQRFYRPLPHPTGLPARLFFGIVIKQTRFFLLILLAIIV